MGIKGIDLFFDIKIKKEGKQYCGQSLLEVLLYL